MNDIILLPTYNEKENIEKLIPKIFSSLPQIKVMVVDDNSPDGTAGAVKELMNRFSNLSILEREKKAGLGEAYKDAMSRVIKDQNTRAIITMDADGSHDPEYLSKFLEKINDFDLIIGSRYAKGGGIESWETWRKNLSKFGNIYAKILTGLPISDLTAGFMCIRRECLTKVDFSHISSAGYSFLIELKYHLIRKHKAKVFEVPIIFRSRYGGESKISNQIIREGMKTPLKFFWRRIWKKV